MRMRRLAVAAAASVVLVGVTGCGGDDAAPASGETTTESSVTADTESEPAEGESAAAEETEEPAAEPDTASGGYDRAELLAAMKDAVAENESAHLVMDIAGGGESMTAEGDVSYAGDTTAMQLTMQAPQLGPGTIEMRMVDGVMYMSMPPMTPEGQFLAFDTRDENSPFGDLGAVTQGDPLATFEAFDEGLKKVEYLGSETVDGEEMDHYVLTVDSKVAAQTQGMAPGGLPKNLTYDLWLDGDDLMRRMQYSMAGGGVTITMSDWGEPVSVKAPAKADIMQLPGQ